MRLDRYVSECQACTRKVASRLIKAGEVTVNGESAPPNLRVSDADTVIYLGTELRLPQPLYFMMHKPAGYVCSKEDSSHPIIYDLLEPSPLLDKLQLVGRLDADTTGLLLLTDDGEWNQSLRSPNKRIGKHYRVRLAAPLTEEEQRTLEQGVLLKSENKPTKPCQISRTDQENTVEICLTEGRYHQVKRMFAAVGNKVLCLHRFAIGELYLTDDLTPGAYRPLTSTEKELALQTRE